jgi:hypothetical protein
VRTALYATVSVQIAYARFVRWLRMHFAGGGQGGRRRAQARAAIAAGVVVAGACLYTTQAVASEPLGIDGFSVQTTRARSVPSGPGIPGYGFVNEAYAFTQAGGHPEALTSTLEFTSEEVGTSGRIGPTRDPKDIAIELAPGLSADPLGQPHCPAAQVKELAARCPADTQVGVFVLRAEGGDVHLGPIVDVAPEAGETVELGLEAPDLIVPLDGRLVRTPDGYAVELVGHGLPLNGAISIEMTLWGVPAASTHNPQRGLFCTAAYVDERWSCEGGGEPAGVETAPFLALPGNCSAGSQQASAWADSWEEEASWAQAHTTLPGVTGCDQLGFQPEIALEPNTLLADAPLGLALNVEMPQSESQQSPATPPLREATVTLPPGMSLSAAGVDGVQACEARGPQGFDMPTGLNASGVPLDPAEVGEGEEAGPDGNARLAPGHCPEASTIGSAVANTPLLAQPLRGRVYLATPGCGGAGQQPCGAADALDGNLYHVYVELGGAGEEPGGGAGEKTNQGAIVKLEGKLQANPANGQLTFELSEAPQLPLSRLRIELNGGPRALLDNPATCGVASTSSELTPWSAPGETPEGLREPGTPDATASSYYEVSGCGEPSSLHPGFLAGSASPLAGAFSPFTLTITRGDREQYLAQIQVRTPPGLLAMLGGVPLCEAALAATGSCPAASRIGASTVAAGAGSAPLEMPGSVYLTGPYEGAPFGLAVVTPALVGPFDLGAIAIRARVEIDARSGALSISSDRLPQIVLGVPLRLRRITLDLDRPDFVVNPTNCDAQEVAATVTGAQGANASVSSPFALGACRALAFKPALKASTHGKPGSSAGAALEVKLTYPASAPGSEANLARIKLALPRQLASRLTTLQGACEDTVFEADPAACPKTSIVGVARARTPVLAGPLVGPVYFVSHGAAAFPSLVVVLQGEGVQSELSGSTEIDAKKITSVTFAALPDVPVSSFEAILPTGPHSALGAGASLCPPAHTVLVKRSVTRRIHGRRVHRTVLVRKRVPTSLALATELVAQNGAAIHRATRLEVSGCPVRTAKAARAARTPKFKIPTFL